ncbi:MAG: cytochrome c biogenesis protein CcdA [Elusimicrobiota bacterium]|nr:cytochrome c biogenesis protein CcdA [Elusimicrobiota bacterium]
MGQYFAAFGAGLMSFFSPCILPLLPAYLSMLSGFSASEIVKGDAKVVTRKVVGNAAIFIAGFTLAFALMGAAASSIGDLLAAHKDVLMKVFGVVMVLFGAHMTGLFNLNLLNYDKHFSTRGLAQGPAGSFLMGFAFALGWSPCIGPILAVILGMAAVSGTAAKGVSLLLAYSAGMALPLLAAAFLTAKFFTFIARFRSAMRYVEITAGLILAAAGALLFFDKLIFWV